MVIIQRTRCLKPKCGKRIPDTPEIKESYSSRELERQDFRKALINNMKDFILELGKDFTFIDEEYRVQVGGEDFAIDLLFFHRGLQCLVAFELKIGKFKPEYISKMDFYLEALDRQKNFARDFYYIITNVSIKKWIVKILG